MAKIDIDEFVQDLYNDATAFKTFAINETKEEKTRGEWMESFLKFIKWTKKNKEYWE